MQFRIIKKKTLHELCIINNGKCRSRPIYGNYNAILDGKKYENVVKNFYRDKGALILLRTILIELSTLKETEYLNQF